MIVYCTFVQLLLSKCICSFLRNLIMCWLSNWSVLFMWVLRLSIQEPLRDVLLSGFLLWIQNEMLLVNPHWSNSVLHWKAKTLCMPWMTIMGIMLKNTRNNLLGPLLKSNCLHICHWHILFHFIGTKNSNLMFNRSLWNWKVHC